MIRVAICDDELIQREALSEKLRQCAKLLGLQLHVKQFLDGKSLLSEQKFFSIVFMDIELGDENGFDITLEYKKKYPNSIIIILTSHSENIEFGYRVTAFRYLIKPVKKDLLMEALSSALNKIGDDIVISIHDDGIRRMIHIKNIVYVEAGPRSVIIRTLQHTYHDTQQISDYEKILNMGQFYRVHKSYIVNMSYIANIDHLLITTRNKEKIKISCKKEKDFRKVFDEFQWLRGNQ